MLRSERYSPKAELEPSLVQAYAATFIPRLDLYPWQQPDGKFITVHKPLDSHLIVGHLLGHITLGAYALDQQDMAKWICFDADSDESWQGLLSLAADLEREGILPYREPSRRGGHLWLFLDPLSGTFARRLGKYLMAEYNLIGIELYPKQDFLNSGPGSLVRLPLGVHRKSGRKYHFVTRDGQPLAPTFREQIRLLAAPERVPMPFIMRILVKTLPTTTAPASPPPKPQPEIQPILPSNKQTLSERLKSRISVLEFVSRYVALDASHTGFCPFHDDQQKSFGVNAEGNYWNCFAGCGGGSLIDFWMKWREKQGQDASFTATIKELRGILF